MGKKILASISLAVLILAGCSNKIDNPSGVSDLPSQPETPRGLTASIGDGQVVVKWAVTNAAAVDKFVVYFSDSAATSLLVFDTTEFTTDTVDGLVNGRRYYFRVSAIDTNGIEGYQSTPVTAAPGIFSILIAGGEEYINTRPVNIVVTAPDGTGLIRFSEDPQFGDAHWENYGTNKSFTLSDGDGLKTVYAQFEMDAGGMSVGTVSDDITLDRAAVIDDIKVFVDGAGELPADTLLHEGDTLRFEMSVGEDGKSASVDIAGLGTVTLNDFGVGGDLIAGDHVFSALYIIPDGTELSDALITAHFTDVAGNTAPALQSDVRMSVTSVPPPVQVWGFAVSSREIQLLWSPSAINDFSQYRVFRAADDTISPPYTDSVLAIQIVKAADAKYLDVNLNALTEYHYWVYVDDSHGNSTRSATVKIKTLENLPPDTVSIMAEATGDSLQARISWIKAALADDFEAYYIVRDRNSLPPYTGDNTSYPENLVVKFISDKQTTTYLDTNLPDTGLYYYQVYVVDQQGMVSRSNQDTVRVQ